MKLQSQERLPANGFSSRSIRLSDRGVTGDARNVYPEYAVKPGAPGLRHFLNEKAA